MKRSLLSSTLIAFIAGSIAAYSDGLTIPPQALLNLANTWSQTQTFTLAPVFTDASGSRTALGLGAAAVISLPVSIANGGTADTGTAWTTFTSTPTCSGTPTTITAAGAFKTLGKISFVIINVTGTNIGTCIGFLNLSAPAGQTSNRTCTMAATDNTTTTPKHASWGSGNTVISVIGPANTFPIVNGDTLTVSGTCEIQ